MVYFLAFLTSYIVGSLNFAVWISKKKGVDLFTNGSGNPGATNVKRLMGSFWGNLVFIFDFLKGVAAVYLVVSFNLNYESNMEWLRIIALLGVIVGHTNSFLIKFKGGKGVATSMGGIFAIMPEVLFVGILIWLTTFFITKVVALGSLFFAFSLPFSVYIFHQNEENIFILRLWVSIVIAVIIILRHYRNIIRLLKGDEFKFTGKSK